MGLPSRQSADNDRRAAILNTRVLSLRNAHAYPTAYLALGGRNRLIGGWMSRGEGPVVDQDNDAVHVST